MSAQRAIAGFVPSHGLAASTVIIFFLAAVTMAAGAQSNTAAPADTSIRPFHFQIPEEQIITARVVIAISLRGTPLAALRGRERTLQGD